ncbi:hypothetical protein EUTSA_v10002873mg [Eutrema salsugineum]|uniref:HTH myb-type domain-containing protein n=1 Tax=Eutrema salsugineum TaxID=72664 RepID=V4LBC5_EUTSA|nr:hypothetical protein EUTSA_v10002873mg [Eutrema salsugineum]
MSSQELKKKEKGKEIFTLKENPSTSFHRVDHFDQTEEVSMYFTEQGIAALLEANKETLRENLELEQSKKENGEKVEGIQEKKSSSSKITPCIFYTSDDKARLRWSSDLHDCFVNAVAKLGGPDKATPKSVREKMEVEGIALHHVKSHLQKFRLGKCNIRDDSDPYNKRFINPYVTIEPQSMPGSSITQQELHLNHDWLIQDSYPNAAFLHTVVQPNIDSLHQGSSSNSTIPLSITPQPIQTYNPYCTYNYPPYNTLEAVKAQLSALQNSSTSRARETPSREINVSSSVSRDEEDPVDMYIDWDKVEEVDIDQLDPVAVLEALGFGV